MGTSRGMGLAMLLAVGMLTFPACSGNTFNSNNALGRLKVGLAYDYVAGSGDKGFAALAAQGVERARQYANINVKEVAPQEGDPQATLPAAAEERLQVLAREGYDPIIAVGSGYVDAMKKISSEYPKTRFALVDDVAEGAPSVNSLVFAENEGSYLVGAAAALKSKSKKLGMVAGCDLPVLHRFEAGYTAGAKAAEPSATVQSAYLSTPEQGCPGFVDTAMAKTAAAAMYDAGADVVFNVASNAGAGIFQAAQEKKGQAIGVDIDEYQTADSAVRDVIITSMLKRVDNAVFDFLRRVSEGQFTAGTTVYNLRNDGVGYSTSGGQIDNIKDRIEEYRQKIIDGEITVPTS